MAIATGTAIALAAAASAGSSVAASAMSSHAANKAAKLQTDSANHGADLQKQSTDEALKFQREAAENDFRNQEAARLANYQQYAARYRGAQSLGQTIGMNLPDAEPYVPGIDPNYAGTGAPPAGPTGAPGGDAVAFIRQWQNDPSHKPTDGPGPLIAAMKGKGFNVSPFMYGQTASNNEINLGGQKFKVIGAEGGPNAYWYAGGNDSPSGMTGGAMPAATLGALFGQQRGAMVDPREYLVRPFAAGTLGASLGGRA